MDIRVKICSAQHNTNVAGIVQDALAGLPFLTRRSYRVTLDVFYDCIATLTYQIRKRLYPDLDPEPITVPSSVNVSDLFKRAAMYYPDEFDANYRPVSRTLPGRVLASALFPADFYYSCRTYDDDEVFGEQDPVVLIENGILRSGDLVKKVIGSKRNSIVHVLAIEYGPYVTSDFLSNAQFLCHRWFPTHGFSFGIGDCLNTKGEEVQEALDRMYETTDHILHSNKSATDKERELNDELNSAISIGQKLTKNGMVGGIDNSMVVCTYTGAKGNYVNCTQISAYLGQQNIMGERVPTTLTHKSRALPHYKRGDQSPAARGFIDRNFLSGLSPTQFFFHAAASREGLMDTAVKTQKSGYIQRCFVKKMENFRIHTDGTVRDCDESIVAFVYGELGFDPRRLYYVNDRTAFVDVERLACRLNSVYRHHTPDQLPKMIRLKDRHIDTILQQIQPPGSQNGSEVMRRVMDRIHAQLRDDISRVELYANRDIITQFSTYIVEQFYKACIEPGDMVGLIGALSLGELTTQTTLNTFHSSGVSSKAVTTGVPRLTELLNVTKKPKTPSTIIRLQDPQIERDEQLLNELGTDERAYDVKKRIVQRMQQHRSALESTTVRALISSHRLVYVPEDGRAPPNTPVSIYTYAPFEPEWWFDAYFQLHGFVRVEPTKWLLELTLDQRRLFELRLTVEAVCDALNEKVDEHVFCVPSPQTVGRIMVTVYYDQLPEKLRPDVEEARWPYYYARNVLTPQILDMTVCGVDGIERIYPTEIMEGGRKKWVLDVQGCNLTSLAQMDVVNFVETLSDDMWEIYETLDIDAVRLFLIEEVRKVLCSDGAYINPAHFMLLADSMTRGGEIAGVRRHDIDRSVGPITKAAFEEAMTNFLKAAIYTENDDMKSVSSTVAFGRLCKIGTESGYFDLITTAE